MELHVGDIVRFGSYPLVERGKLEPIEWRILSITNDLILMVSEYGLDAKPFDSEDSYWTKSGLNRWIKQNFLGTAFTPIQRLDLKDCYCLSGEQSRTLFPNDDERKCFASIYAMKNGAEVDEFGYCDWWLRDSGDEEGNAMVVKPDGSIFYDGRTIVDVCTIRPAISIMADAPSFVKALKVEYRPVDKTTTLPRNLEFVLRDALEKADVMEQTGIAEDDLVKILLATEKIKNGVKQAYAEPNFIEWNDYQQIAAFRRSLNNEDTEILGKTFENIIKDKDAFAKWVADGCVEGTLPGADEAKARAKAEKKKQREAAEKAAAEEAARQAEEEAAKASETTEEIIEEVVTEDGQAEIVSEDASTAETSEAAEAPSEETSGEEASGKEAPAETVSGEAPVEEAPAENADFLSFTFEEGQPKAEEVPEEASETAEATEAVEASTEDAETVETETAAKAQTEDIFTTPRWTEETSEKAEEASTEVATEETTEEAVTEAPVTEISFEEPASVYTEEAPITDVTEPVSAATYTNADEANKEVITMGTNDKIAAYEAACAKLNAAYAQNVELTGNSFSETYKALGVISAVTRIMDEYNKMIKLAVNPASDKAQLSDSLMSLANYCIMTYIEENK